METSISGRHLTVTDEMRQHVEQRFARLTTDCPSLTSANVVIESERGFHVAEGHVHGKHLNLDATARTNDVYASIDQAIDKLEKQLRRHLDRTKNHHGHYNYRQVEAVEQELRAAGPETDQQKTVEEI